MTTPDDLLKLARKAREAEIAADERGVSTGEVLERLRKRNAALFAFEGALTPAAFIALIEGHNAERERLTRENQLHPDDVIVTKATWAWMKQRAESAESALAAERKRVDRALVGGNHLGTWASLKNWPHFNTSHDDALKRLGAGMEYDAWCCWRALMLISKEVDARAALAGATDGNAGAEQVK